jgi:hypothetical protein
MSVCKSTSYPRNSVQNAADLEGLQATRPTLECAENFCLAFSRPTTVAITHRPHRPRHKRRANKIMKLNKSQIGLQSDIAKATAMP